MKSLYLLSIPLLAAQAYAAYVSCTGTADTAFREPDFTGGAFTIQHAATIRDPNSYTTTNETWLSQGYYTWALTVPRGTKALSSEVCGCMSQMENMMKNKKELCVCQFGSNNQSTIGVGRTEASKKHQKREYPEFKSLYERARGKDKRTKAKGVAPIKMPKCQKST